MAEPDFTKTFNDAFRHAEKVLKRFERIGGETLETAINQLRYASRHYLDATQAKDDEARQMALNKALSHCRRAEYDAVEASIAVVGESIINFDRRYLESSIEAIIPNYPDYYAKAIRHLAVLREEDAPRNLDVDLTTYSAALEDLIVFWDDISSKEPLVSKLDYEKRWEQKVSTRRHITNTLLTVLGILVAIVVAILSKVF